jgi:hypothetical protein
MRKRILGFDLDDVVIDFNGPICGWHNVKYGSNYCRADIKTYELGKLWQCPREEANRRVYEFYFSQEHQVIPAVAGAIDGLRFLQSRGDILVSATSRPAEIRDLTLDLLTSYGVMHLFEEFHFLGHWHGGPHGQHVTKASVCREVEVELFVEDSLSHAQIIATAGIPVLLLDTPWNQGETPPLVTRVPNWEKILEKIG